ncbi:hypothetical protein H4582DRAFT_2203919 [Lactarius indigo]|nr:hypothetical protein H4582DRAFT_2203919 [Lactarius indigo]
MDNLRTKTVAAGRGETRPHETTTCTHDAPRADMQHSAPDHTMDSLRQFAYIEPVGGHDVECTTDKPEPSSFIDEKDNPTLPNRAKYGANERSTEQISRTQTTHKMSTKRLSNTRVEANARRLEHSNTELRGNCEGTRTTEHRALCHEKGQRNPEIDYESSQKEPTEETPLRNHDNRIDRCQRIEKHDSDEEVQRTDTQGSINASSITKNHSPYANPEPRPSTSRTRARYGTPEPNSKTDHGVEEVVRLPNEARRLEENGPTRTLFRDDTDYCQQGHDRTETKPRTHEPSGNTHVIESADNASTNQSLTSRTMIESAKEATKRYMLCMYPEDTPDTRKTNIDNLEDMSENCPLNIGERTSNQYARISQVEARVEPLREETHRTAYTNQLSRSPCKTVTRGDAPDDARTNQISRSPCDRNARGDALDDRIITSDETVRRSTNEQRLEALDEASAEIPEETRENKPPWETISRRSRNGPTGPKKASDTITPVKAMRLIDRKDNASSVKDQDIRRKTVARMLGLDEATMKQIVTELQSADVDTRRKMVSRLTEKLENEREDEDAESNEDTAVRALTAHVPKEEYHDEITVKLTSRTPNNSVDRSETRSETPNRHVEVDENTSTKAITTCERLRHDAGAMLDLRTADKFTNRKREEKSNLELKLCKFRPIAGTSEVSNQRDDMTFARRETAQCRLPTYTTPLCATIIREIRPAISRNNKEIPGVERYSTLQRGTRVDTIAQQRQERKRRKSLRERYTDQTIMPSEETEQKFPPQRNDDHVTTSVLDKPTITSNKIYSLNESECLDGSMTECLVKEYLHKSQSSLFCLGMKDEKRQLRYNPLKQLTTWNTCAILLIPDILDQLTDKMRFTTSDIRQMYAEIWGQDRKQRQITTTGLVGPTIVLSWLTDSLTKLQANAKTPTRATNCSVS